MRISFVLLLLSATAFTQTLPMAKNPEELGISTKRLERIHQVMQHDVETSRIPGAVLLIAPNGNIA